MKVINYFDSDRQEHWIEKTGFVPTERFTDNPYADVFMKKDL